MAPAPREIELKLEVEPSDETRLRSRLNHLSARKPSSQTLVSVYYDTPAWALREHGLSLRVRRIGREYVQTVKCVEGPLAGLYDRAEWEHAIRGPEPELSWTRDTALGPLLRADVVKFLRPAFYTRVHRTTYRLTRSGTEIGAAFDRGVVRAGSRHRAICEVELELSSGHSSELFNLARVLGEVAPLHLAVQTKADRGYELLQKRGVALPTLVSVRPTRTDTAAEAFQTISRGCLRQLITNEKPVLGGDAEALHRMRVALRKLRAAISVFSQVVKDRDSRRIKSELGWLSGELGPARDIDVFIVDVLSPLRKRHRDDPGVNRIFRDFERRRALSYRQVATSLQSERLLHLELEATRWIEVGPWVTSRSRSARRRRDQAVTILAADALTRGRKKLRDTGRNLAKLSRADRHKLRIRCKKLRYAVEFFSDLFPGKSRAQRCKSTLCALEDLQNSLGALNDLARRETLCFRARAAPGLGQGTSKTTDVLPKVFTEHVTLRLQGMRVTQLLHEAQRAYQKFRHVKPFWN